MLRYAPMIPPDRLKSKTAEQTRPFLTNLHTIRICVEQFSAAVALYDHIESIMPRGSPKDTNSTEPTMIHWLRIAARDGAITANAVDYLLGAIEKWSQTDEIQELMDVTCLTKARELFDDTLPNPKNTRNGAAHPGEFGSDEKQFERHAVKDGYEGPLGYIAPGATTLVEGILHRDTRELSMTYRGKIVSCRLTKQNADTLETIVNLVYDAYTPMSETLIRQHLAEITGK